MITNILLNDRMIVCLLKVLISQDLPESPDLVECVEPVDKLLCPVAMDSLGSPEPLVALEHLDQLERKDLKENQERTSNTKSDFLDQKDNLAHLERLETRVSKETQEPQDKLVLQENAVPRERR